MAGDAGRPGVTRDEPVRRPAGTADADGAVEQLYAAHWRPLVRLSRAARARRRHRRGGRAGRLRRGARPLGPAARPRPGAGLPAPGGRQPLAVALRHLAVVRAHAERQPAPAVVRGADEAALETDRRADGARRAARTSPAASARCSRCATTSTCPRPRSPTPSASAAGPSRATRRAAPPPCAACSPITSRHLEAPHEHDPRLDPRIRRPALRADPRRRRRRRAPRGPTAIRSRTRTDPTRRPP